jgi:RNA polymerase sigma-70 factor, ECF subfamily
MSQTSGADDDRSEFRTNLSLIKSVRDGSDVESWRRFHEFYAPLLMRYLRRLGLEDERANDLVQDVFVRLLQALPTFELDSKRGRFRSYLWKLTYSALVDEARRFKTRRQAEEEWVKRFHESSEAESRKVQDELNEINQQQILNQALPRVHSVTSRREWMCFEQRVLRNRPGSDIAAEVGISAEAVYVYASRVLKAVRKQCAALADDLGDDPIDWPPQGE